MCQLLKKFGKSQDGSNLIEFALVLPVFLIILIGIIDLGNMLIINNALDAGARTASRFGLTGASFGLPRATAIENEVYKTVQLYSGGLATKTKIVINVVSFPDILSVSDPAKGTVDSFGTGGQAVKYTINYSYKSLMSMFGLAENISLKGTAVVQNEAFP